MIVVPCAFGAILNDWLASLGLSRPSAAPRGVALSLEQWEAQVHAAIALAPGPARGLDIGRHVRLQHVGPLGYLLVNTRTLSEFFETYLLLDQWFYGCDWAQVSVTREQVVISWDERFGRPDRLLEQLHVMALLSVVRSVCPAAGQPLRIGLMGAAEGEGLGNKFLANIRETDAIAHVVRCFEDENVIHVANSVDPKRDIEIIDLELIMADLDSCEKQLQRVTRSAKGGDKEAVAQKALLEKLVPHFTEGKPARSLLKNLGDDDKRLAKTFHLLTTKPVMYIANVAEDGFDNNPHLDVVRAIAEEEGAIVVPVCNKIEAEIAELDDLEEMQMFLETMGMTEPGLNRVIRAGYQLLNLQTYFTAGVKEVRAWTVRIGATAPQAAAVIHTDFEKGFIRAEVISYDDFIQYKGEAGAKEAGKWRLEGKEYIVKDGDVMHFRFNV